MKNDIEWLKKEIGEYLEYEGVRDARIALKSVLGYIDQLDEPEVPVIPQFVADWIDAHNLHGNNPLREYRDLENDFNEGWTDEKDAEVYHWVNKNPYAFIDSLRYGCEVEEEQKYYVLDKYSIAISNNHEHNKLPKLSNQDIINEPNHYKGKHGIETIDVIRNFGNDDMVAGFYWGNAIKYMTRYRSKNGLEDLKKARKNLDWLIEHTEAIE